MLNPKWIYIPHFGFACLRESTSAELAQFLARQTGDDEDTRRARQAIERELARREQR